MEMRYRHERGSMELIRHVRTVEGGNPRKHEVPQFAAHFRPAVILVHTAMPLQHVFGRRAGARQQLGGGAVGF